MESCEFTQNRVDWNVRPSSSCSLCIINLSFPKCCPYPLQYKSISSHWATKYFRSPTYFFPLWSCSFLVLSFAMVCTNCSRWTASVNYSRSESILRHAPIPSCGTTTSPQSWSSVACAENNHNSATFQWTATVAEHKANIIALPPATHKLINCTLQLHCHDSWMPREKATELM